MRILIPSRQDTTHGSDKGTGNIVVNGLVGVTRLRTRGLHLVFYEEDMKRCFGEELCEPGLPRAFHVDSQHVLLCMSYCIQL